MSSGESLLRHMQTLLGDSVQRVREHTGSDCAVAWALREDGAPYVAAAAFVGNAPRAPDCGCFAAAAALPHATDLTERRLDPELRELGRRYQCTAAAPVSAGDGHTLAVLLLRTAPTRAARGPSGVVPPRVLAELDASARRLAGPLATTLAVGRLRRLDGEVRRLDRLAALGSLGAEIAHEVRNPLVSIKTFLQLLPERRHDAEFLGQFCEVVKGEAERMERLLDTLVEYGSPVPADPVPDPARAEPVLDWVRGLLAHRAQRKGVALETRAGAGLPALALGEDALRQVILNLVQNALDVTPSGGTVRLRAGIGGDGVEVAVSDAGPGVPEALRELVFEPFFSTRQEGSGGLGLAISRRIVEEAGGSIRVGDAPGGGAEFRILLPAL